MWTPSLSRLSVCVVLAVLAIAALPVGWWLGWPFELVSSAWRQALLLAGFALMVLGAIFLLLVYASTDPRHTRSLGGD